MTLFTGVCGLGHCQNVKEKEEGSTAHRSDQEPSYVIGAVPRRERDKTHMSTGDKATENLWEAKRTEFMFQEELNDDLKGIVL